MNSFITKGMQQSNMRSDGRVKPDFNNLVSVLKRKKPDKPTLFEFFLNPQLYRELAGPIIAAKTSEPDWADIGLIKIEAFKNAGYDYVEGKGCNMRFNTEEVERKESISLNSACSITDRSSFNSFNFPNPDLYDYGRLQSVEKILPDGMKVIVSGPGGVLENVIALVGYEKLCLILFDNPRLADDLFAAVGERMVRYYYLCSKYDSVGALISNDDWGFKTQTMLSPTDMRKYVIPWHKKIVAVCHEANKPVILHSCGKLDEMMHDIINVIGYDGKHSYEDAIEPVEQFYDRFGERIAVLGGIDVDFLCRSSKKEIHNRCKNMLSKADKNGGFALGTGNSVPSYVPNEKYYAMIDVVRKTVPQECL